MFFRVIIIIFLLQPLQFFAHVTISIQDYCIDVVIPACAKDAATLNSAINGIRKNGIGVRRIIVVSDRKYTDQAEWFDEKKYPFTKSDIKKLLNKYVIKGKKYEQAPLGWLYQQLLKLYALYVIPDIADNVLVLDADTIFLNPVSFIDEEGYALYNVGIEFHPPYFTHAKKLILKNPIKKIFSHYSGICNHMLFQRKHMTSLFDEIQGSCGVPLWQAMLLNIDPHDFKSCMSEYEIYFNYIFGRHYPAKIRLLSWDNLPYSSQISAQSEKKGLDYISCHSYLSQVKKAEKL